MKPLEQLTSVGDPRNFVNQHPELEADNQTRSASARKARWLRDGSSTPICEAQLQLSKSCCAVGDATRILKRSAKLRHAEQYALQTALASPQLTETTSKTGTRVRSWNISSHKAFEIRATSTCAKKTSRMELFASMLLLRCSIAFRLRFPKLLNTETQQCKQKHGAELINRERRCSCQQPTTRRICHIDSQDLLAQPCGTDSCSLAGRQASNTTGDTESLNHGNAAVMTLLASSGAVIC